MACRHDALIKFIDIVGSGEKLHFSVAALEWLVEQTEETAAVVNLLYDVGCNLHAHVLKVTPSFSRVKH